MYLERLELRDFRNYETLRLDLAAPLTLFCGANGQGKTNILEAVLLLALSRSPRTTRDGDLIRWGATEAVVRGEVRRAARQPVAVAVGLHRSGGKTLRVDGQPRRRLIEVIGEVNAVLFGPDGLRLVSGGPSERRAFLNGCLGQTSRRYLAALANYRAVLRQRNALLKSGLSGRLDEDLLLAFDDRLASEAAVLIADRAARVADLARHAAAMHHRLSGAVEALDVAYEPDVPLPPEASEAALAEAVRARLLQRRAMERRRGVTLCGPHRDDLAVRLNGTDARTFGSQGQQRTAALALKMAELRVVAEAIGEPPLLLLDDVLSELDDQRRVAVLQLVEEADQVLVTAAQLEPFGPRLQQRAEVYHVSGGRLMPGEHHHA